MRRLLLVSLFSLSFNLGATGVFESKLSNGLQVVVKQDKRAPVVVHQLWYRVGSSYEPTGITGVSHILEHMMFKGTDRFAPGEFSKRISAIGGRENAFTSTDYTAYYQIVGKQHLAEVMDMESDRMANLALDDKEFQPERNVVKQERLWSTDDKPSSRLFELFKASAFINSPARNPVIGWMQDIENYELRDLQDWYEKWYAPNNATLVVVGDVEPDEVVKLAEKTYGKYPPKTINIPKPQFEVEQQGKRIVELKDAVAVPSMLLGFHAPTLVNAEDKQEVYALNVLASILDGDASSRLPNALVRQQKIASQVGAFYRGFSRYDGQFIISAQPQGNYSLADLEDAIFAQLDRLKNELISDKELARVLAQAEAQHIYHQDSTQAQANSIGRMVSVGLPADTLENWVDKLRSVTPEQVQQVAQKYLLEEKLTLALLKPNGETNRKPAAQPDFNGRVH